MKIGREFGVRIYNPFSPLDPFICKRCGERITPRFPRPPKSLMRLTAGDLPLADDSEADVSLFSLLKHLRSVGSMDDPRLSCRIINL